jgi:chemotaxis protein CheD
VGRFEDAPPGRFVSTAVVELVGRMQAAGAARGRLRARVVGGATMFEGLLPQAGRRLGGRNVEAARRALRAAGVPVDAEDVGGNHGRTVTLDVAGGGMLVTSVHNADVVL